MTSFVDLHWRFFVTKLFLCMGGIWTFLSILIEVTNISTTTFDVSILAIIFIAAAVSSSIISFIWLLISIKGTRFPLKGTKTDISVKFGDVFSGKDCLLVPVNNFFDHELVTTDHTARPVSPRSVHGQLVSLISPEVFREKVDQALAKGAANNPQKKGKIIKRAIVPNVKYPIGTIAPIEHDARTFYLVAVTETIDEKGFRANGRLEHVFSALASGWTEISAINDRKKIVMPLIGSGFADIQLHPEHLLEVLIASIMDFTTRETLITEHIEIRLPTSLKGQVRCYNLRSEWS